MKKIMFLLFMFGLYNCTYQSNKNKSNIVEDYIDSDGERVVKYGYNSKIDSTKIYTSEGKLSFEKYMYGDEIPVGKILERGYYDNGNFSYVDIGKDTMIIIENKEFNANKLMLKYHENGILSSSNYFWLDYPVGLWINYDTLGIKINERFCYPNLEDKEKAYNEVKEFYPSGIVKSAKMYYYFAEDDYPIGTWKYYNEKGKLIKEDVYVDGEIVNK